MNNIKHHHLTILLLLIFNVTYAQTPSNNLLIWVNGACGMCEERIETTALQTMGVETADWDVVTKELSITVSENFVEKYLHYAISGIGHDTKEFLASDEVYNTLPDCCQYRPLQKTLLGAVSGTVLERVGKRKRTAPLMGVNVHWLDTDAGTTTDIDGSFSLERSTTTNLLVVSYIGYAADTIDFTNQEQVEITMSNAITLDNVEVTYRRKTTEISFINPLKVETIGSGELIKAACCNLSESFETNPSVDVSFTDAVTGTRQIQMLGLAGPYVQITRELIPDIRALSAIEGLTYTPGPWISSIQLAKGAGSVTNGFESMTGQINVELKKPENSEKFFLNVYRNLAGRTEANINWKHRLSDEWSTGFMLHGSRLNTMNDVNKDGFLDSPLYRNFIGINRWRYQGTGDWEGQFGIKVFASEKTGGQVLFAETEDNAYWGSTSQTERYEAWLKAGRLFSNRPNTSFGSQFSTVFHNQVARFGTRNYASQQRSFYGNLIYQSILGTTLHKYKAGLSILVDNIEEYLSQGSIQVQPNRPQYDFTEIVPGAYVEYTWLPTEAFTLVGGLRYDQHNLYGGFITPRLNLRYAINEKTVARFAAGSGRRTARVLAENLGKLASNRLLIGEVLVPLQLKDLEQEIAWNIGANLTHNINLAERELVLSLDAYHTLFQQQLIVDLDEDAQRVFFYNLDGKSYSTSLQAQVDYEIFKNIDIRLAYRFNDVKVDYLSGLLEKPFVSRHRAFINAGYKTEDDWMFDATLNWRGSQRLPDTKGKEIAYQLPERSPDFFLLNAQISKSFAKKFDIYLGGENLLDFRQDTPILAPDAPFGEEFDASLVWGPIFGRNVYAGIRWRLGEE